MQCPNCKFYKVDTETHKRVTGNVPDKDRTSNIIVLAIIVFFAWLIIGVIPAFIDYCAKDTYFTAIWSGICVVYFIYCVIKETGRTEPIVVDNGHSYECRHCGYTWSD